MPDAAADNPLPPLDDEPPEGIVRMARSLRSTDWHYYDELQWRKSAGWRRWTLRVVYDFIGYLRDPTARQIEAGAAVIQELFETDEASARLEAHCVYLAMIEALSNRG